MIHTVKGFGIVNETQVDILLEFSCFFYDSGEVGNLITGSSAFSKSNLNIWEFSVHILMKPSLGNLEPYFASLWNQCNCVIVWTFFGLVFLWDWKENSPFPVLWPLLSEKGWIISLWAEQRCFCLQSSRRAVSILLSMIIKAKTKKNKWKKQFPTRSQNWLSPCNKQTL